MPKQQRGLCLPCARLREFLDAPAFAKSMFLSEKPFNFPEHALASVPEQVGVTQKQLARPLRKPQSFMLNYERGAKAY